MRHSLVVVEDAAADDTVLPSGAVPAKCQAKPTTGEDRKEQVPWTLCTSAQTAAAWLLLVGCGREAPNCIHS